MYKYSLARKLYFSFILGLNFTKEFLTLIYYKLTKLNITKQHQK